MVIVSAAFVTRALVLTILLNLSVSRQLFTIFITAVQAYDIGKEIYRKGTFMYAQFSGTANWSL